MRVFKTEQENFISDYKTFQAKIKNIDLDIEEFDDSVENIKKLENLKKEYIRKVDKINLFLENLNESDRRIVILKYIEKKSGKYVGDKLNMSPGSIGCKASRIKKLILKLECE